MTRILSVLALVAATLAGLTVAGGPAHATVTVTIHASRTSLAQGQSSTISGKVAGARTGSVARLQRRATKRWRTVDHGVLGPRGGYAFKVTPPVGKQRYRVRVVGPDGSMSAESFQAVLEVYALPYVTTVDFGLQRVSTDAGPAVEITAGPEPARASGIVRLQELVDGQWVDQQTRTLACLCDATFVQPLVGPRGPERIFIGGDARHTPATRMLPDLSAVLSYQAELDGPPVQIDDRVGGRDRQISFRGSAGDVVGYEWSDQWALSGSASLTDADGQALPAFQVVADDGVVQYDHQWQLPADGTYVLRFANTADRFEAGHIVLHKQLEISAAVDSEHDFWVAPGQAATIVVPAVEGQDLTFAVYSAGSGFGYEVTGPAGPIASGRSYDLIARRAATVTGDYAITIPNNDGLVPHRYRVAVSVPREFTTTPNAGPLGIPPGVMGQVTHVSFDAAADDLIGATLPDPFGSDLGVTLTDAEGSPIDAVSMPGSFWRIPRTGSYSFEYAPATHATADMSAWQVTRAVEASAVVNTGPIELTTTRPGQAFEIWFDAQRDQVVTADFAGSDDPTSIQGVLVGDMNDSNCDGLDCSMRAADDGRYVLRAYAAQPGRVVVNLTMENIP